MQGAGSSQNIPNWVKPVDTAKYQDVSKKRDENIAGRPGLQNQYKNAESKLKNLTNQQNKIMGSLANAGMGQDKISDVKYGELSTKLGKIQSEIKTAKNERNKKLGNLLEANKDLAKLEQKLKPPINVRAQMFVNGPLKKALGVAAMGVGAVGTVLLLPTLILGTSAGMAYDKIAKDDTKKRGELGFNIGNGGCLLLFQLGKNLYKT